MGGLRRYRAGEKFRPRASDLNRIADAVEQMGRLPLGTAPGDSAHALFTPQCSFLVRNDTGADVPRFGVMDIGAPIFTPADNLEEFCGRASLKGLLSAGVTRHGLVLVAQAPIGDGRVGRCTMLGATVALVKVRSELHTHAELEADETVLQSAFAGPAQIVWLAPAAEDPPDPDVRLALVVLGPVNRKFTALTKTPITQDGSSWRWTYGLEERVFDAGGAPIAGIDGLRDVVGFVPMERYNATGSRIAPGLLQSDNPQATLFALPIAAGVLVEVTEIFPTGWERGDDPLYAIEVPNPVRGECT